MSRKRVSLPHLLLLILVLVIAADAVIQARREIVLQGFFTNDDYNMFPADEIRKEYGKTLSLTPRQMLHFEDDLYVEVGSSKDYTSASAAKLMAYVSARELDFIVTTRENLDHYKKGIALEDMRNLTDSSLLPFLVRGEDGNGEEKAIAIEMSGSRFVRGRHPEKPYYLFTPKNSRRKEAVRAFLVWAFSPGPRDTGDRTK